MNVRIYFFILVVTSAFAIESWSNDGTGGQPGAFLRRGVGSRALGMGNAFTSIADDPSAVYWNPAGLTEIEHRGFMGMFSILSLDREQLFVSAANNFSDILSVGVGWYRFGVTDIDGRDNTGMPTKKSDDVENSIYVSLGKQFDIFSIGVTGKYLHHSLFINSASGFGFDIGARLRPHDMLSVGVTFQDIAGKLTWDTQSELVEEIPLTMRGGIAFHPDMVNGTIAIEAVKTENRTLVFKVGGEYKFVEYFGVRMGYDGDRLSFGGLLKSPTDFIDAQLDYAATKDQISNEYVHHISLIILP